MDGNFFVIVNNDWTFSGPNAKRLQKGLFPLGRRVAHLAPGCEVLVRFRDGDRIALDRSARIVELNGAFYLKSETLTSRAKALCTERYTAISIDGRELNALCSVQPLSGLWFDLLEEDQASLRLGAFDLPPQEATDVTNPEVVFAIASSLKSEDPELASDDAARFLDSPHILMQLLSHAFSLRSEDAPDFVIDLRKVAEQLRRLVVEHGTSVRIHSVPKSHIELWAEVQGSRIAFIDGGVARIPGVAKQEPMAMRVGTYSVVPGEPDLAVREGWRMQTFLLQDCVDAVMENTDRRRLMEAARYTFEPLAALHCLEQPENVATVLLHGPLVNQFAMYDEGEPNFIPHLRPSFLELHGICSSDVMRDVSDLPMAPGAETPYWNHFMAVYAYVMHKVEAAPVPIAGVVERASGRPLTTAVLSALHRDKVIDRRYIDAVETVLKRYDISDELLFGCMLREGEYVTPLPIEKNTERRSRERWKPVVRALPRPAATMLKTDASSFPFRIEMNKAAHESYLTLLRLVYHTARLLPRYAFPVGLDIADKYAKVPDWVARGISGELSSLVLRRALRTGDPDVVAQIRQLLASSPRDFFFRPRTTI